jgi:hypothetical protein
MPVIHVLKTPLYSDLHSKYTSALNFLTSYRQQLSIYLSIYICIYICMLYLCFAAALPLCTHLTAVILLEKYILILLLYSDFTPSSLAVCVCVCVCVCVYILFVFYSCFTYNRYNVFVVCIYSCFTPAVLIHMLALLIYISFIILLYSYFTRTFLEMPAARVTLFYSCTVSHIL